LVPIDPDLNLFAKEESLVAEWHSKHLHPRAKKIAIVLAQYLYPYPGVITSIRAGRTTGKLASGIHAAWRAIDMRSNTMVKHEAEDARKRINKRFRYDDQRDTIPPLDHGTAPHFHIQVKQGDD
jgi:hypothetical protein